MVHSAIISPTVATDDLAVRAQSYRRHLQAQLMSPNTVIGYMQTLDAFAQYLRQSGMPTDPAAISREHCEAYLVHMREQPSPRTGRPYAPSSIWAYYLRLHAFFKWLVEMDEIRHSPMERQKPPHVPQKRPPALSDDQVARILRRCEGKSFYNRRDMALLRLLRDTGMRLSEAANIRMSDIDWERRGIPVVGKGRKPRICWFGPHTARALDLYINWARNKHPLHSSPRLWLGRSAPLTESGIYQMVKARGKAAGIEGVHPHMFRHYAAYSHLRAKGSEVGLMRRMGWSSRDMVSRYTGGVADDLTREEYNALGLGDKP